MHAAVPRFFVDADQVESGRATLIGADANHLSRVASRARPGETIVIVEDGTVEHGLELDEVTAVARQRDDRLEQAVSGEPRLAVHVLQAIPAQAMDATVEALTEAGAATIRPVLTHRTVVAPRPSRVIHRLERWRTIAREAAQLAGRAAPPAVSLDRSPLRDALDATSCQARASWRASSAVTPMPILSGGAGAASRDRPGHRPRGRSRCRGPAMRSPMPARRTCTSDRARCRAASPAQSRRRCCSPAPATSTPLRSRDRDERCRRSPAARRADRARVQGQLRGDGGPRRQARRRRMRGRPRERAGRRARAQLLHGHDAG